LFLKEKKDTPVLSVCLYMWGNLNPSNAVLSRAAGSCPRYPGLQARARVSAQPPEGRQLLKFLFNDIPDRYSPTLTICSAHFSPDSFVNLSQFNVG